MKRTLFLTGVKMLAMISTVAPGFATMVLAAPPDDIGEVRGKLCDIMGWLYTFALIVGVICIILAAFSYMTASGSTEKVDNANKMLRYAVIGIVVAILATSIPAILGSFLGSSDVKSCP